MVKNQKIEKKAKVQTVTAKDTTKKNVVRRRRREPVMKYKFDNKTSRLLIRLAKAINIDPRKGWKERLAEELKVSPNALSNWVARDRPMLQNIWALVDKYDLPSDIIRVEERIERIYFSTEAAETWPFLADIADMINEAAKTKDTLLLYRVFQSALDKLNKPIDQVLRKREVFP